MGYAEYLMPCLCAAMVIFAFASVVALLRGGKDEDEIEIKRFKKYRCRVKMRPEYNGNGLRPGVKAIDGKEFILMAAWMQDKHDNYPGEWAMDCNDSRRLFLESNQTIMWISSGDLEILGAVDE